MSNIHTYNVGVYCRLSRDDGQDSQSMSISNQKESILDFIKGKKWNLVDVYVDDGYSGTNFNRPGFTRLIDDVENNKIDCIITKDLSRLGRNYLQTGYYTEEYFPNKDVRFIAINDNFDTKKDNEFAPFKNIINEWYAKDISKKVKFSLNQKMKQSNVLGCGNPLYGYLYEDGKRVINPEVYLIVKRIASEYINGKSSKQIAVDLGKDGIYSPGYYNYLKFGANKNKYKNVVTQEEKCKWNSSIIVRMITNIEYTGTLINHKTTNKSFKNKKRVRIDDSNQYVFEQIFVPIISKEEHEAIKKRARNYIKDKIPNDKKILQGILCCSSCGSILKYNPKTEQGKKTRLLYSCRNKNCKNKIHIKVDAINFLVEKNITNLKNSILQNQEQFLNFSKNYLEISSDEKEDNTEEIVLEMKKESSKLDIKIQALFDANLNDEIPLSTYQKMMKNYKNQKEELESRINSLTANIKKKIVIDYYQFAKDVLELFVKFDSKEITYTSLLFSLIKSAVISKTENKNIAVNILYKNSVLIKEYLENANNSSNIC